MKQTEQLEDEALTGVGLITMAAFPIVLIATLAVGMTEKPQSGVYTDNPKNWKPRLTHKTEED